MAEDSYKRYTSEEREYYEAEVEEAAQKAAKAPDKEVERLINEIVESADVHEDLKLRMYRDVITRLKALQEKARSEREKKVLKEYEGYVQSVDGKFRPAGIDKKFKVTVRAGAGWNVRDLTEHGYEGSTAALYMKGAWWKTGRMFDRMFGRTVDSDSFHKIIEDVEKAREDVDTLKRELELLRASEKSIGALISLSGSGFFARVRSRGITSVIGAGFESTGDFFSGLTEKYWGADRKREKEVSILIAKKMKDLKEKEALRDATLKKLDELREGGKVLFDKAFKPEVDVLMLQKEHMSEAEYKKKMDELRKKIAKWSEKTGFVHMEVFLDDMLGVKSQAKPELTERETKKQKAKVSAFLKEITGKSPNESLTGNVMSSLAAQSPDTLRELTDGKKDRDLINFMRFLIQGKKFGDVPALPDGRRMEADANNIVEYLLDYPDYLKECRKIDVKFEFVVLEFAKEWTGVKAENFDDVFDLVLAGRSPEGARRAETDEEKKEREASKKKEQAEKERIPGMIKSFWKTVSGQAISPTDFEKMEKEVMGDEATYNEILNDETTKAFLTFFFQGKYLDYVAPAVHRKKERRVAPNFENFLDLLGRIEYFLTLTADKGEIQKVLQIFASDPAFLGKKFETLDNETFKELLNRVRAPKKTETPAAETRKEEMKGIEDIMERMVKEIAGLRSVKVNEMAALREQIMREVNDKMRGTKILRESDVEAIVEKALRDRLALPSAVAADTQPPVVATPVSKTAAAEAPDESGMTSDEKVEFIADVLHIEKPRAQGILSRLPPTFEWKWMRKYDREIEFLFTGKYVSRQGNKIISLEGNEADWRRVSPSPTNLMKLVTQKSLEALEKIEKNLPRLLKESGFTQSTVELFFYYLLDGKKAPDKSAMEAEANRKVLEAVMDIPTSEADEIIKKLPANLPWKLVQEYEPEIRFLYTGKYVSRDGNTTVSLEGPPANWKLFNPTNIDDFLTILEPEKVAAIKRMRANLPKLLQESGYTRSTFSFFKEFMIRGRTYEFAGTNGPSKVVGASAEQTPPEGTAEASPPKKKARAKKKKKTEQPGTAESKSESTVPAVPSESAAAQKSSNLSATLGEIAGKKAEALHVTPTAVDYLTEALQLQDKKALAEILYSVAFETDEEWQELLAKPENQKKLRFFVTGRLNKLDYSPAALPKDEKFLADMLAVFPIICKMSIPVFRKEISAFFKDRKPLDAEAMSAFVEYLKLK